MSIKEGVPAAKGGVASRSPTEDTLYVVPIMDAGAARLTRLSGADIYERLKYLDPCVSDPPPLDGAHGREYRRGNPARGATNLLALHPELGPQAIDRIRSGSPISAREAWGVVDGYYRGMQEARRVWPDWHTPLDTLTGRVLEGLSNGSTIQKIVQGLKAAGELVREERLVLALGVMAMRLGTYYSNDYQASSPEYQQRMAATAIERGFMSQPPDVLAEALVRGLARQSCPHEQAEPLEYVEVARVVANHFSLTPDAEMASKITRPLPQYFLGRIWSMIKEVYEQRRHHHLKDVVWRQTQQLTAQGELDLFKHLTQRDGNNGINSVDYQTMVRAAQQLKDGGEQRAAATTAIVQRGLMDALRVVLANDQSDAMSALMRRILQEHDARPGPYEGLVMVTRPDTPQISQITTATRLLWPLSRKPHPTYSPDW